MLSTYKVVELSTVTDDSLEAALNEWTGQGWTLEGIHFAMRESSKRPAMAFIVFTRVPEAPNELIPACLRAPGRRYRERRWRRFWYCWRRSRFSAFDIRRQR